MWVEATTFKEPQTGYLILEATTTAVSGAAISGTEVSVAAMSGADSHNLAGNNCCGKEHSVDFGERGPADLGEGGSGEGSADLHEGMPAGTGC